jgi:hypothetical protein
LWTCIPDPDKPQPIRHLSRRDAEFAEKSKKEIWVKAKIDDLVKSPVSHEVTEITKRILNIFNVPFFVALWLREKILVLTTESRLKILI